MVNHACIAIGINHYQFLEPLSYGQADARALQKFLVDQAGLPSEECLLLTDSSLLVNGHSTYPSREMILRWLEVGYSNSKPNGNWRWFFFSGYGVCWRGVDYLMPIDGNPRDILGTGIPMRSLLSSLKNQGDNILVLLDINRSAGLEAGTPVGAETVELAHELGISLVLSSQVGQFSHEAAALGNGLFTAALLEALRYYHTDTTLEKLAHYLGDRLPELSQHHWRPIQTPLIVVPSEAARHQRLLPSAENLLLNERTAVGVSPAAIPERWEFEDFFGEEPLNGKVAPGRSNSLPRFETPLPTDSLPLTATTLKQVVSRPEPVAAPERPSRPNSIRRAVWRSQLLWGGGAILAVALLALIAFRQRNAFIPQQAIDPPVTQDASPSPIGQASPAPSPKTAVPPQASPTPTAPASRATPPPAVRANASPSFRATSPAASAPSAVSERLQANEIALAQARLLIRPNQASLFSRAIAQARRIQPGDPLYAQAQQDVSRWSQVIVDLAEGRAKQGNFKGAIAAAQLVPKDDPAIYTKAQETIKNWQTLAQQQQQNQGVIQAAKQQLRRNQASSYNRALTTLRRVPPGQPGYAEAQQLTDQWSRTIYLIANSRAAQGKFRSAVQTAALVPKSTPSYGVAQDAIARWKQGKR